MRKRSLCCGPVSVGPSVTLVHCIQTAEDIVRLLYRLSSPITLSFLSPSAATQFQREPLQRVRKIQGWENFAIFVGNRRLSQKRYEIGPWLLWNVNRNSCTLSNGGIFNDLDGPTQQSTHTHTDTL